MSSNPSTQESGDAPWASKAAPSGKQVMRRLLPWLGLLLLVLAVAWGLWPKPVMVEVGEVVRRPLTVRVSEEGKTRIRNRYEITAPVAGTMDRVELKAGDPVVAGETVLTRITPYPAPLLDPRSRLQAEAALAMNRARREQSTMALESAKIASRFALNERDRMRSVTQAGTYSESAKEKFESEATMRQAEWRAAEFAVQVVDYEIARAQAMLERPEVGGVENQVAVKSPVSGVVLKVIQESEMAVQAGQSILEIGDPADIEIEAEILSRDAVAIEPGDEVLIEQWGGESPLPGRVRRVEPAAFTKISALGVEEQRVLVLIDLVDPAEQAKALGDRYRVEVRVAVWHADDVLAVPAGALFREGNDWKVYLYDDGEAVEKTLEAGQSDGRFTQVLSGIEEGDAVLLHPPDVVRDGSSVEKREME